MKALVTVLRILVGLLFIFSGFIKANDPIGMTYKMEEYFHVFQYDKFNDGAIPFEALIPYATFISITICILEIVLGFALLIGTRMHITAWLLLITIVYFTFLTWYSAYFDKVKDCGCFGEFIKLTPWTSFWKDIFLLIPIIIIFIRRHKIRSLFTKKMQTRVTLAIAVIFSAFSVYCLLYMPVINFLPWKPGADVCKAMEIPPQSKETSTIYFIYKVNGEEKKFTMDDVTNNKVPANAEYVDRIDEKIIEGELPKIHDFSLDRNGTSYTDSFLKQKGYYLIIVSYDLDKSLDKSWDKLSKLSQENASGMNIPIWALTSSSQETAEKLRHDKQLMFDFYNTDSKALQTMIRSNPGVLLMKGCEVIENWSARSLPKYKKIEKLAKK